MFYTGHRNLKLAALAALTLTMLAVALAALATRAGAKVLDLTSLGAPSGRYGVLEAPDDAPTALQSAGIAAVANGGPCQDPRLTADLVISNAGLCWQQGPVIHASQTFAITWDAAGPRSYWAGTRGFLEQFLRDVADGSGTLSSPFAVATQYADATGPAANQSVYGGGCIDYGVQGGSACRFADATGTGPGHAVPGCPPAPAGPCVVDDADIQNELTAMVTDMGLSGHLHAGTSPILEVLLPSMIEDCIDASGTLCQAIPAYSGSTNAPHFCSYHSHLEIGGTDYAYVVQPWTTGTSCDEPKLPSASLSVDAGQRLVSSLSAATIATLVDPQLDGWMSQGGDEIYDHGCAPGGASADAVQVGGGTYSLQPEFSNAGLMEVDPNAPTCALSVALAPRFIVPNPVDVGDVVAFDGSVTNSSLIVPAHNYAWDFGDGSGIVYGPSVVHSYAHGGSYSVKLTVTDRGANTASVTQTVNVAGPPPPPPAPQPLDAHLQLVPQSLRALLNQGVGITLSAREAADGFAYVSIPTSSARQAHLAGVHGASMIIGRGAVSGITATSGTRHLLLPLSVRAKLRRLRHLTVTIHVVLVGADGVREAIDLAGHY